MKFFHEAPISMFHDVQKVTDGDYALVHLFETHKDYYELFKEAVVKRREVILDNSIFELGESYDAALYEKWILDLKPSYYVVPDVLENAAGTAANLFKWIESGKANRCQLAGAKMIGVVQGKSEREIQQCYNVIEPFVDMVAISFDYSFFENGFGRSKLDRMMRGRQRLIHKMNSYANKNKPHHLLGTALMQEGMFYKDLYPWIYSIDTSNPVAFGLQGDVYHGYGESIKPKFKMASVIDEATDTYQLDSVV